MSFGVHGPTPDAAGFVLAGGRSSRMGRDKALVNLGGQPLVVRTLKILRDAGLTASIAGSKSSLTEFAPVVDDPRPDLGPLSGICAALHSTAAQYAVFMPLDLPFVPASLIRYLLQHARLSGAAVALVSLNGFAETFPVVVDRVALPVLREEFDLGRGACFRAFQSAAASLHRERHVLPVELLVQAGQVAHPDGLPPVRWFLNLNTPEDLRRAAGRCCEADSPARPIR